MVVFHKDAGYYFSKLLILETSIISYAPYDARGKADAIVSMYILPKSLVPNVGVIISYDDKEYGYGFDATTLPTSTTGSYAK